MSTADDLGARVDELLRTADPAWPQAQREAALNPLLVDLTSWHRARCPAYDRIVEAVWAAEASVAVPWLPVGAFKHLELCSVPREDVVKVLTSSGTTGGAPSRVFLDRDTARRQTRALASVMTGLLGPHRRPMLVVDSRAVVRDPRSYSARGAGILGMLTFGRDHTFVLDADGEVDRHAVHDFAARHAGEPLLVFGFTFMVWEHLLQAFAGELDLADAVLVHSGGWKALQAKSVDEAAFRGALLDGLGIAEVRNFYGMVEQVGGVFLEGDDGLLHPPPFADVVVRDPQTWEEAPVGVQGLIEVRSPLPMSYPGHALLTEDLGTIVSVDDPRSGVGGKALRIHGRVPRTELRGCSDTHARSTGEL